LGSDYDLLRKAMEDILFATKGQTWEYVDDEELLPFTNALKQQLSKSFKLYRYSDAKYWNLRNFETQSIMLSPNGKLNDIYEGIPNCDLDKVKQDDWNQLKEVAFLKCFSEDPLSLLMWSHYANEYQGICIEYDLSLLPEDSPCLNFLYPVSYTEKRYLKNNLKYMAKELKDLQIELLSGNSYIDYSWLRDISSLFLVKGVEWAYEKEWRIIVTKLKMKEELEYKNKSVHFNTMLFI